MLYFGKRIRSFYARKIGSVGQRASKLLAVKVGGLKKKSANRLPALLELLNPDSTAPRVEPFSNFDS